MNRIDRLFNILILLQSRRRIRAVDIAQQFGITERTVYRDMAALSEMGIPIVSLPGEGYELMEGYYLPPLVFTPDEASALFLGSSMLRASGNYVQAAQQALDKLTAALPTRIRERVERQTAVIGFIVKTGQFDLQNPYLIAVQDAIHHRHVMHIRYHSLLHDETTERDIEPHTLTFSEGVWYINSYCRLSQGWRTFRLDRIEKLSVLPETFLTRQPDFNSGDPHIAVRVRFASAIVRWVHERQHYGFIHEQAEPNSIIMTYHVERPAEIKNWIMGWGAQAEVLEPQTLRDELRQEAQKLLDILT